MITLYDVFLMYLYLFNFVIDGYILLNHDPNELSFNRHHYTGSTAVAPNEHSSSTMGSQTRSPFVAAIGTFPYQVAFVRKVEKGWLFYCGGGIIQPQLVVTAAVCVNEIAMSQIYMMAGFVSLKSHGRGLESLTPFEIIVHPDYNKTSLSNNIAVVLVSQFSMDSYIGSINLTKKAPQSFQKCKESGWGSTIESGPKEILMGQTTTIDDLKKCQKKPFTTKGMICGVEILSEHCIADSGSPLVCDKFLYGIVSHGVILDSNKDKHVEIYSDVHYYKDWILKTAAKHKFNDGTSNSNLKSNILLLIVILLMFRVKF